MPHRVFKPLLQLLVLLIGLWLGLDLIARLSGEVFWFQSLGYLQTFGLRIFTKGLLWTLVFGLTLAFLLPNFAIAQRLEYPKTQDPDLKTLYFDQPLPRSMGLSKLLATVLGLSGLVGVLLLYHGQVAWRYWQPEGWQRGALINLPSVSLPIPARFQPASVWPLLVQLPSQLVQVVLLLGIIAGIAIAPRFSLIAIAGLLSVGFGLTVAGHWAQVLQYFHAVPFGSADPLFQRDISFYVFTLPIAQLVSFWLVGLFLYGLASVSLLYLLSGDSLSQGKFPGFSAMQLRHLYGLGSCFMGAIAWSYWISRYELLYSKVGVVYGASYTDANVNLPAYTILSLLALVIAVCLLGRTIFWPNANRASSNQTGYTGYSAFDPNPATSLTANPYARPFRFRLPLLPYTLGVYLLLAAIAGTVLPTAVQRFIVQPNELARERPFIERNIALTRQAFGLEAIETETFAPTGTLTAADLQENDLTIRNIRLWDTRPLLETNRQLQQIRLYYQFPDADVDRYTLLPEGSANGPAASEKQQVLIAARELDYSAVPQEAQTWVNQHLIYTHGYGFTLSPVNQVGPGGLPYYFVRDIGVDPTDNTASSLAVSSDRIRASIPIGQPRIYYGELTNTYVMTGTNVQELDYPSGNENVYNTYDGRGGVSIGSQWRRLLFAKYLNDWQMLLTRNFTSETKLLFRRNIDQRIRAIAPFLRYDSEPYLVTADATPADVTPPANQNYLYWIVDAYTTSDRYPYSDPGSHGFNYIRNSVKVVIDAYNGSVDFYVADPSDPLIRSWAAVFPKLFKPLDALPPTLRSHIRYPVDFFSIQSDQLMTYHMTDPQVFYNREDQWQVPTEIYGSKPQLVEPYYLITSLPDVDNEEFILLLPYTPRQRNNMIAWLAARSDGDNYGRLLLYEFPKQQLVYGPEQIEARINQDPIISQQISLWNRQGSRAIQGNLLVIPIEQSLLYVEPLYLEAEQNSLPTLVRVIVAYQNRIAMAETLEEAVRAVFQTEETSAPAIVRPVPPSPE